MKTLSTYEMVSAQLINSDKSHFMIPSNTPQQVVDTIKLVTGFNQQNSLITYLGCPLYIGGQRIIYYSTMVDKVVKKIRGWQSRILSYSSRATLVKYVSQLLPIHTLSAISPPKTTLKYIKKLTADFFWGWD